MVIITQVSENTLTKMIKYSNLNSKLNACEILIKRYFREFRIICFISIKMKGNGKIMKNNKREGEFEINCVPAKLNNRADK